MNPANLSLMALLDRIDPTRYDVEQAVRKLNEFNQLTDAEQDSQDGALVYADLEEHPLSDLCGEANNTFFVLRDLRGELEFIWETSNRDAPSWEHGPLYQGNLSSGDLDPYLAGELPLDDLGIPLSPDELAALVAALPDVPPGPLRSF